MRAFSLFGLLAVLLLALPACDGGDPEEPEPVDVDPTFEIASRVVTLDDNSQGLQFFVTPNMDVTLNRIEIRNPLGQGGAAPIQNLVILGGQTEALQEDDFGFFRVSGSWRFSFGGTLRNDPTNAFDVTTTLNVSALRETEEPPVASE